MPPETTAPRMRILLVDDSEIDRELCRRHLRPFLDEHAIEMVEADSGHEALAHLDNETFACVLLDYNLPDLTGLEILTAMKAGAHSDQTVAIMTGQGNEKVAVAALKGGARDYIVKDHEGHHLTLLPTLVQRLITDGQQAREHRFAEREIRRLHTHNELILNAIREGIFGLDTEGTITFANPAAARMIGQDCNALAGSRIGTVLGHNSQEGQPYTWESSPFHHAMRSNQIQHSDRESFRVADRDPYPVEYTCSPLADDSGKPVGAVVVFQDITRRKLADQYISDLAFHDQMTGLGNRLMFKHQANAAIARARRQNSKMALIFVDLDHFKTINDTLGHDAGDQLLCGTAERLRTVIRGSDDIYRMGGDEFILIVEDVKNLQSIEHVVQKISQAFEEPFDLAGTPTKAELSMGVAVFPWHGDDMQTLMKNADNAMYKAKKTAGTAFHLYEPVAQTATTERDVLAKHLGHALQRNEFEMHFQPQFATDTMKLCGFEALLRWNDNKLGSIRPDVFIPLSEETAFIHALGDWALNRACHDNPGKGHDYRLGVNISAHQLKAPGFADMVEKTLKERGVDPSQIDFEIKESFLVDDHDSVFDMIWRLHRLGIQIVVDDFGVGYSSSIAHLKKLPITRMKIDKALVRGIPHMREDVATIPALITMAHKMNVGVVAEGVENEEQLAFLHEHGCDMVQGFYLGKPGVYPNLNLVGNAGFEAGGGR